MQPSRGPGPARAREKEEVFDRLPQTAQALHTPFVISTEDGLIACEAGEILALAIESSLIINFVVYSKLV
jgi:hypothetical protein